jgi:hypothetical protein
VAKGTDIENAMDLFKHVGEKVSNVKLYFIDNVSIESITFPNSLKYIKGTMGLHQTQRFGDHSYSLVQLLCFGLSPILG